MENHINIKKKSFELSTIGKILIAFEMSFFAFGIILPITILMISIYFLDINLETNTLIFHSELFESIFSDKIMFYSGMFLGVISTLYLFYLPMTFAENGFAKSRLFWRFFPINKSGKKKVIEKMNKKIITLKEKSLNRPQEIQNEIQEYKEYIFELENELTDPCPYQQEIVELRKTIQELN